MAVFRVHKTRDFTVMSNSHLRDKDLTLKAKGLLSVILSLPDDWKYSIAGLASICKEGTSAVKSALQELTDAGYVTVTKMYPNQTESGRIEYVYDIHERPQAPRKQGIENLPLESQQVENQAQLSTEESSTNESNTKESSTKKETRHKYGEYKNVLLSDTDMEKLQAEFPTDWEERIERLSAYMASTGKSYKNHLATIRNWARMDRQRPSQQPRRAQENGFDKKIDADYYYQSTGDEEVDKVLGLGKYAPNKR